jgi:hypothetical protein
MSAVCRTLNRRIDMQIAIADSDVWNEYSQKTDRGGHEVVARTGHRKKWKNAKEGAKGALSLRKVRALTPRLSG